MQQIIGIDFAKDNHDQPVLMDKQQVFDSDAWRAHLRLQDLVWRHCKLDVSKNLAHGMEWLRDAIKHGELAYSHNIRSMWIYNESCIVLDPYDDFRRSLGIAGLWPDKPASRICLAVLGYLYGRPRSEWYDDLPDSAVMS